MSSTLSTKAKKFTKRPSPKSPAAAAGKAASTKKETKAPKKRKEPEPAAAAGSSSKKKAKAPKKQKKEELPPGVFEVSKISDHFVDKDGVTMFTVQFKGYKKTAAEAMTAWQLYKDSREEFSKYLESQGLLKHLVS